LKKGDIATRNTVVDEKGIVHLIDLGSSVLAPEDPELLEKALAADYNYAASEYELTLAHCDYIKALGNLQDPRSKTILLHYGHLMEQLGRNTNKVYHRLVQKFEHFYHEKWIPLQKES
jgi:hypothetical protein